MENCIDKNMTKVQNQNYYNKKYDLLKKQYDEGIKEIEKIKNMIEDKVSRKTNLEFYLRFIKKEKNFITDFNKLYWNVLLNNVLIDKEGNIKINFIV